MKFVKLKYFMAAVLSSPFLATAHGGEFDPVELREVLRETSIVSEDKAKSELGFKAEKSELENRLKLLNALKSKLEADIKKTKQQIKVLKDQGAQTQAMLQKYSDFENNISAFLNGFQKDPPADHSQISAEPYAGAKDCLLALRQYVEKAQTVSVININDGVKTVRFLRIGNIAVIPADSSPEAAKACNMVDGKIPYEIVELEIKGRGTK